MQVINNNELFTQVAAEESSIASGGGLLTAGAFAAGATGMGVPAPLVAFGTFFYAVGGLLHPIWGNI
ncbi:MAG: hypothetical protein ACKO9I_22970 [Sphaerospermopsis kisseleviana]